MDGTRATLWAYEGGGGHATRVTSWILYGRSHKESVIVSVSAAEERHPSKVARELFALILSHHSQFDSWNQAESAATPTDFEWG